jgi:hypothetical protein
MRESIAQKVERESRQREWSSDALFASNGVQMDPTRACERCRGPIAKQNKSGYCGNCWPYANRKLVANR